MIAELSLSSSQFLASGIADFRRGNLSISSPRRITAGYTSAAERPPPIRSTAASPTLYNVLGIAAAATGAEIKAAYRRLARTYHPDVSQAASGDEFMKIHAAYSTLSDPEKRADYDRRTPEIAWRHPPPPPSPSRRSDFSSLHGLNRRTWETDQCW
ncbi:hypothetical protein J5N97_029315 [Dioscorea zingiberensis]|uniref:J domain-containing protein n=1 Tax=Dioscorea zingiberensis TaxID=325984 RepID=A0A9D5C137_9LILI|nr:hypothetical protein J5N97_029315 [Dioscorea zingiberensis]